MVANFCTVIIGGSNAKRLQEAFTDLGKRVIGLTSGGWNLSRAAVDSLIPILLEHLACLPESVPVVLYLLDNSCIKALNENGNLSSITRSQEDRAFYLVGDLVVTPFTLLSSSLKELDSLISAFRNLQIFILGVYCRITS